MESIMESIPECFNPWEWDFKKTERIREKNQVSYQIELTQAISSPTFNMENTGLFGPFI